MTVDEAAAELYVGSLKDFVRRRGEMVAAARQAGDRELATAIGGLRKPTTGAWMANLLILDHRAELEELVALGAALREAQDGLDPDQLRELGKQRYRVVRRLVALGGLAATKHHGQVPGRAADEELEATLTAALADPAAAEQLLSGRLAQGLTYAGLGFDTTASAGPARTSRGPAPRPARAAAAADEQGADTAAAAHAAQVDAAERDLAQARLQAADAQADAEASQRRLGQAQDALAAGRDDLDRLSRELAEAQTRVRAAQEELAAATRDQSAKSRAADVAARRAERAEQDLEALRGQ